MLTTQKCKADTNSTSQGYIIKLLNQLALDIQAGRRDKNTVTAILTDSGPDSLPWEEAIKELNGVGLTPKTILDNKEFIAAWLEAADARGDLEELEPLSGILMPPMSLRPNGPDVATDLPTGPPSISPSDSMSEAAAHRDPQDAPDHVLESVGEELDPANLPACWRCSDIREHSGFAEFQSDKCSASIPWCSSRRSYEPWKRHIHASLAIDPVTSSSSNRSALKSNAVHGQNHTSASQA